MKKLLTIVSVALFGAVIGFACGGGQQPAGESTLPAAEETGEPAAITPASSEGAAVETMGGSAYGGGAYGASAYGAKAGW